MREDCGKREAHFDFNKVTVRLPRAFSVRYNAGQSAAKSGGSNMAKSDDKRGRGSGTSVSTKLVRVVRTETSEVYIIWQDDTRLGQVDIHYGYDLIHATLILEKDLDAEAQGDLVDQLDQDVISSHLPQFAREDFLVTVFRGSELESFSDGEPDVEDDEESDEEY